MSRHSWRCVTGAVTVVAAVAVMLPGASLAATPITTSFNAGPGGVCPAYGDLHVCSGEVPSFDGTPLDVDLTEPMQSTPSPHPLIVMLHGFGNNKHEWESTTDEGDGADKWHWNSHWLAEHGYYVLTYTARGFRDNGPTAAYQPATPSGAPSGSASLPNGTIHIKSREFEVRDTQWLAALVAAAYPDVDPHAVAVTGGSYGGGESWLQASQARWSFPHAVDAGLPVLDLQVAVPKYPWTDLAYSLAPNGHGGGPSGGDIYESSQARANNATGSGDEPFGVPKTSYVTGLYALGNTTGIFEKGTTTTPSDEGPIDVDAWLVRVGGTEPYDPPDPIMAQVRRGLTEFRGSYYQDEGWTRQVGGREVAVFSISGWTDDLFEPIESFRQFKYLKRLDPLWPVALAVADVGHSRAQNKPATWHRLNDQAFQFLQAHIAGSHRQQTTVYSEPTICPSSGAPGNDSDASERLTALTPESLSQGTLSIAYTRGDALTFHSGLADPNGPATDPVVGGVFDPLIAPNDGGCRTSPGPPPDAYSGVSDALPSARTYIGLGYVRVPYTFTGTTAQLDARVWDVVPGGPTLLVTRGAYRLTSGYDAPAGTLRVPLFGNHWLLLPGHRIRLDLVQVDQPYLRPSNVPSTITFQAPRLVLPTLEAIQQVLSGD